MLAQFSLYKIPQKCDSKTCNYKHVAISEAYTKFHANNDCLKRSSTITNMHTIRTRKHNCFQLNNAKIVRANKCDVRTKNKNM